MVAHGTTNPWGHDWNEFGDGFFINTVNGHLWHLIPGAHFVRGFSSPDENRHIYELIDMHADHWHFDASGDDMTDWLMSREEAAHSYGGGHAHSGMTIYLGDNWPREFRGNRFTFNINGRRVNQERLSRHGSGYVGKHGVDLLFTADPFFRATELSYGPDGSVYVVDWSDTGECHEETGVHRTSGRIFRVTHEAGADSLRRSSPIPDDGDLRSLTSEQLGELMTHRNEWFVRQARLILSERGRKHHGDLKPAINRLQQLVKGAGSTRSPCRVLPNQAIRRSPAH